MRCIRIFVGTALAVFGGFFGSLSLANSLAPAPMAFGDEVVGSVSGHCCMPGRRPGCESVACEVCRTACTGTEIMNCTNAACVEAEAADVCELKALSVGLNVCRKTGWTNEDCPAMVVTHSFVCNGVQYAPGTYQTWKCNRVLEHSWRDGVETQAIAVCDGWTTCSFSYSKCE